MNFLIRVDSSFQIGHGHVMRCLTLANYLKRAEHELTFCCKNHIGPLNDYIVEQGHNLLSFNSKNPHFKGDNEYANWLADTQEDDADSVLNLIKDLNFDWLIVDHYGIGKVWEERLKSRIPAIFVLDDLVNREHAAKLLLDTTLGRQVHHYKNLCPEDCEIYVGSRFTLLRDEFLRLRERAITVRSSFKKIKTILVSMGGTDPKDLTLKVVQVLRDLVEDFSVTVVLNEKAVSFLEVKKLISQDSRFKLMTFVKEMSQLMLDSDIAIGAAGISSYERAYLGLPTIMLQAAQNQSDNIKAFEINKLALAIKQDQLHILDIMIKKYLEKLSCIQDYQAFVQNGFDHVSALGVFTLLERLHGKSVFKLVVAQASDAKQVFSWQAYPGARKFARNPQAPRWEEHLDWFNRSLKNKKRHMYILQVFDMALGFLRVDINSQSKHEVSILISHAFYGNGLGKIGLELLREEFAGIDLYAYIQKENIPSQKIFKKCGYHFKGQGWYLNKGDHNGS